MEQYINRKIAAKQALLLFVALFVSMMIVSIIGLKMEKEEGIRAQLSQVESEVIPLYLALDQIKSAELRSDI